LSSHPSREDWQPTFVTRATQIRVHGANSGVSAKIGGFEGARLSFNGLLNDRRNDVDVLQRTALLL
jgi:hypothetical protein